MDPIAITAIIGVGWALFFPSLVRRPSAKKRYQQMDDRKLIDANVSARMMMKIMLAAAFLAPLPLCFILPHIKPPELHTFLICLMILMSMSAIGTFWMYWEVRKTTTAELEYRKFQEEKQSPKSEQKIGE